MHSTLALTRRRPGYRMALALLPALLGLILAATAWGESYPLVMVQGDSQVLHFERMTRVAIADPTIADVAVTSLNDLLVVAKGPGRVMLYVWDKTGQHDYAIVVKPAKQAQEAERQLGIIFGNNFTYTILDNRTLLMKGPVDNQARQDDVDKVAKQVAQNLGIHLVAVYLRPDLSESPAQRQARVLQELLGDKYQLVVWDEHTILVRGVVANSEEYKELDALIKAGNTGGVIVSNLVTIGSPTSPAPVAEIARVVGDDLRVYALEGRTVVVEGDVQDQAAKDRVDKLLAAFADRADIVNLVQVQAQPGLPLSEKRRLLQEAVGNLLQVRTVADKALVVEGNVPDDATLNNVQQEIDLFKADTTVLNLVKVVEPQKRQILVKARVLDIDRGQANTLGFSYQQVGQSVDNTATFSIERETWPVLAGGLQVTLHALLQHNLAKVLAEPNILINDGESGKILVGGEVPIPVPQVGSATGTSGVTITIVYKQFGVIMDLTPTVIANDRIRLKLMVEVSDIDPSLALTLSGFSVPGFRTRHEETVLDMTSGETFAIGGLLQTTTSKTVEKLPVLGDLPILGSFFRSTGFQQNTTELMILLTPELMGERQAAAAGADQAREQKPAEPPLPHEADPDAK